MNDTEKLIAELSTGLRPVGPALPIELIAMLWFLVSAAFVIGITHWFGPIRATALAQLAAEPRFLVETVMGTVAIACTAIAAFRAAVPGALTRRFAVFSTALMLLWLANYVVGLEYPALEPSMLGKRDHCFSETIMFASPPALLAFLLTRRRYPLRPVYGASLFSLAAGMMPALYMQIACRYLPVHILQMHIFPGMLVMVIGGLCALLLMAFTGRQ